MNSIKLWDIDSNYIYYNNLNEFLLENDLEWFEVKDSFKINDKYIDKKLKICYIKKVHKCHCGGIGRRTGFKIQRETMWVRVPPVVPK